MLRLLLLLIFAVCTAAWAQDDVTDDTATESAPESVDDLSEEELDDLDLSSNEDHTEEDEDIFRPTDVVSYQQSVPFPVDI